MENSLDQLVNESISVIEEAFKRYGNKTSLCYNGGKDSTILLDMVAKYAQSNNKSFLTFYIEMESEFPEVLDFIEKSQETWGIEVISINADNIKQGLEILTSNYDIESVFLGVRKSDVPRENLSFFDHTTKGWASTVRVMPLLQWSYDNVWRYIDGNMIPVCKLYEMGYTSLGSTINTIPNPDLKNEIDGTYKHARYLKDPSHERLGRNK